MSFVLLLRRLSCGDKCVGIECRDLVFYRRPNLLHMEKLV